METLRIFIMAGMVLMPGMVIAATNCRVIEYPDHYDVECVGDEKSGTEKAQAAPTNKPLPVAAQFPVPAQASVAAQAAQVPPVQVTTPVTTQTAGARDPFVIGEHRPDKAVRAAARASRARLILEERQKQLNSPIADTQDLHGMSRN
ncbi:MAG: hypothetical protein WA003_15865 [Desulfuromonadaceae bacterium]